MSSPLQPLSDRILSRLIEAHAREPDPWLRDDLMIARLTVAYAGRGDAVLCSPHVVASFMVLGLHPDRVWPAIQERRRALGFLEEVSGGMLPPKKPPRPAVVRAQQSLWLEKTSGARAFNSRPDETLLRDNTISVPMAAPSIAALFPNSEQSSSVKTHPFTLDEIKRIVGYSGAPDSVCRVTISALRARGEWPHEDGPATTVLSVAIIGMMLEGVCCRRTVQRRIKRAVQLGYWRRVRDANSWTNCPKCGKARTAAKCSACEYRGRSKDAKGNWTGEFLRVPVYEFDVHKFRSAPRCREIQHLGARTYAEYKQSAKRGELIDMSSRKPAQPAPVDPPLAGAAPVPAKQPAAEHGHRNTMRPEPKPQPKLTKRECIKFVANVEQRQRGRQSYISRGDGLLIDLQPGESGYSPPMAWEDAFQAECVEWKRDPDVVRHSLKCYGYKFQE